MARVYPRSEDKTIFCGIWCCCRRPHKIIWIEQYYRHGFAFFGTIIGTVLNCSEIMHRSAEDVHSMMQLSKDKENRAQKMILFYNEVVLERLVVDVSKHCFVKGFTQIVHTVENARCSACGTQFSQEDFYISNSFDKPFGHAGSGRLRDPVPISSI
ncbi:hypothetical protein Y032_0007g3366 [Ancylostoma ceylanicum]|nr:hypothetical protein Y032_0007g3366 [Ancylostoma ceylanicum]